MGDQGTADAVLGLDREDLDREDLDGGLDAAIGAEMVADAAPASDAAPFSIDVELPPGTSPCPSPDCAEQGVRVAVCPQDQPGCAPSRSQRIRWSVNGQGFNRIAVLIQGGAPGFTAQVRAGAASMFWNFVMVNNAAEAQLDSDLDDLLLTHHNLSPTYAGDLELAYVATGFQDARGASFWYRYSGYDPEVDPASLHAELSGLVDQQVALLGRPGVFYQAFFMPTEIAITLGAEGNLSLGGGVVTINYGNPDWLAMVGGARLVALHEFSHEYTHELFATVASHYLGNHACLNEGIADAVGVRLGVVPEDDFCPRDGLDCAFVDGCLDQTEMHDQGNCVLWHARDAGLLDDAAWRHIFAPQRVFDFDSCDFDASQTGNALDVLFSEAAGADATAAVQAMGIPCAASYEAALAALGW